MEIFIVNINSRSTVIWVNIFSRDPYDYLNEDDDEEEEDTRIKPMKVEIDLALSAYANARK